MKYQKVVMNPFNQTFFFLILSSFTSSQIDIFINIYLLLVPVTQPTPAFLCDYHAGTAGVPTQRAEAKTERNPFPAFEAV